MHKIIFVFMATVAIAAISAPADSPERNDVVEQGEMTAQQGGINPSSLAAGKKRLKPTPEKATDPKVTASPYMSDVFKGIKAGEISKEHMGTGKFNVTVKPKTDKDGKTQKDKLVEANRSRLDKKDLEAKAQKKSEGSAAQIAKLEEERKAKNREIEQKTQEEYAARSKKERDERDNLWVKSLEDIVQNVSEDNETEAVIAAKKELQIKALLQLAHLLHQGSLEERKQREEEYEKIFGEYFVVLSQLKEEIKKAQKQEHEDTSSSSISSNLVTKVGFFSGGGVVSILAVLLLKYCSVI